jgi:hypothetical protein
MAAQRATAPVGSRGDIGRCSAQHDDHSTRTALLVLRQEAIAVQAIADALLAGRVPEGWESARIGRAACRIGAASERLREAEAARRCGVVP